MNDLSTVKNSFVTTVAQNISNTYDDATKEEGNV
jgi:hypothetical protein